MLRLTNSEVHIIMGNTHAIAKKSTFIKKHPTLHLEITIVVRQYSFSRMFQRIFHDIDFEE